MIRFLIRFLHKYKYEFALLVLHEAKNVRNIRKISTFHSRFHAQLKFKRFRIIAIVIIHRDEVSYTEIIIL